MTSIIQPNRDTHLVLPVQVALKGFYKLHAVRPDGRRRLLADWFPNLITDGGLNRMGTAEWGRHAHVGSGSAAPTATDTAMQSFVASTSSTTSDVTSAQATSPYYTSNIATFRFAQGAAAGNLSEVGIGWGSGSAGPLFSRALILDGVGNPTTITVLADEFLDVTYEIRLIPPTTDSAFTIVDSGPAGTSHSIVLRAANVTSSGINNGWGVSRFSSIFLSSNFAWRPDVYNGTLGDITQFPNGSVSQCNGVTNTAYANNSLEKAGSASWGLDAGNVSGGITAVSFTFNTAGTYQASFDPAIPKDNTKTLSLGLKVSWTRATI